MPRISSVRMTGSVSWLLVVSMIAALLLPLLNPGAASAAQLTARSIDMSSSEPGVTAVTYDFAMTVAAGQTVGSFRVEFCNNDPLPGTNCSSISGDNIPDFDAAVLSVGTLDDVGNSDECTSLSLEAVVAGDRYVDFACAGGADTLTGVGNMNVTLTGVVNPTNTTDTDDNNTFYARLYTYAATSPDAIANPVTGYNNEGGVAMSTAQVITVDARVQEILDFCVGTQITTVGDCSTISGDSIDLGTLDQTQITRSSAINGTSGACDLNFDECAILVVTTNATSDGVAIDYRAQGFDVGTTCPTGTTAGGSVTDQCLNPVHESAETSLSVASEAWGIAVINSQAHASSTTTNLTRANDVIEAYDFDAAGYAVDDGDAPIALAQSDLTGDNTPETRVVDREQLEIEIAASPAYTTPSGAYQTTLEFIATGTF
jgi:hypothetical protein